MAPVAEAPKPVEAAVPIAPTGMVELDMAKGAEVGTWAAGTTVVPTETREDDILKGQFVTSGAHEEMVTALVE